MPTEARETLFNIRVTDREKAHIEDLADELGMSMSEMVRQLVEEKRSEVKDPVKRGGDGN